MTTYPGTMTMRGFAEQHRGCAPIGGAGRTEYGNK